MAWLTALSYSSSRHWKIKQIFTINHFAMNKLSGHTSTWEWLQTSSIQTLIRKEIPRALFPAGKQGSCKYAWRMCLKGFHSLSLLNEFFLAQGAKGTNNNMQLSLPFVAWLTESFVWDPGVSCLLPTSRKRSLTCYRTSKKKLQIFYSSWWTIVQCWMRRPSAIHLCHSYPFYHSSFAS